MAWRASRQRYGGRRLRISSTHPRDSIPGSVIPLGEAECMLSRLCARLFYALFLTVPATSQTTTATVSGTVTDQGGAVMPRAQVTALDTVTGVTSSTLTNEAGVYVFGALQAGTYRVTAERLGF